jgi:predicted nucleic acid-binding Zn ribbon protein
MKNSDKKFNKEYKARTFHLVKNHIICPECNAVLKISEDLLKEKQIQCSKCNSDIFNPLSFSGYKIDCPYCGNFNQLPKKVYIEPNLVCDSCHKKFMNPYSRNLNRAICPICGQRNFVPNEFQLDHNLNCEACGNKFKNPLKIFNLISIKFGITTKDSRNEDTNKSKIYFARISVVILLIVAIIFIICFNANGCNEKNNDNTPKPVEKETRIEEKVIEPEQKVTPPEKKSVKKTEKPVVVDSYNIAIKSIIIKQVGRKYRYFFDIRNNSSNDFNGDIGITISNNLGDSFSNSFSGSISEGLGSSVYIDLYTGPPSVHGGDSGMSKYSYIVKKNGRKIGSGEGRITSDLEEFQY